MHLNSDIFAEDLHGVMRRIIGKADTIFTTWSGELSPPQDDITWLFSGHCLKAQDYIGQPNYFDFRDMSRQLLSTVGELRQHIEVAQISLSREAQGVRTLATVVVKFLSMIADGRFPAGPLLAHHHMVGGEFRIDNLTGHPYPVFAGGHEARMRPANDAVAGIRSLLEKMGIGMSCGEPAFFSGALARHRGTEQLHDVNMSILKSADLLFSDDDQPKIPEVVPFWGSLFLMSTWTLADELFNKFVPNEVLFDHINGNAGELACYVDADSEFFVVFTKGFDTVSQLSAVTAWLITGKASRCEFMVDEKKQVFFGQQTDRTFGLQLHDCVFWHVTGGITTGGSSDRISGNAEFRFKLAIHLAKYDNPHLRGSTATQRTTLVLCTRVPQRVTHAMSVPGPLKLNRLSGALESPDQGKGYGKSGAVKGKGKGKW